MITRRAALEIAGTVAVAVWLGVLTARVYRKPIAVPSHKVGLIGRTENLIAGTNIGLTTSDNTTTGQQDVTINNTSSANVQSVTGAGTVSCSPTTGAVTCTGSGGGSFTCSNLNPCNGGQLPAAGIGPANALSILFTNQAATSSIFANLTGDVDITGISAGNATTVVNALQGAPLVTGGTTNLDTLTFVTGTGWTHAKPYPKIYSNVSGSIFSIGTSLTSCVSVSGVVVGSGQQAYATVMAWVASTDGSTNHNVQINLTNVTNSGTGQLGQVDLGSTTGANGDATLAGENIDNSVGTFTYATQLARTGSLSTGTVTAHWCSIQVVVQ